MEINKENLPLILNRLGKETRRVFKDTPVDIWVVGGANLLYSFDFRDMTADIDVIKNRSIDLKDIALKLEEELDLPHNWINDSVMFSDSFSRQLRHYVSSVKEFNHSLVCHFISPVAITAMKVKALRPEKSDLLDALCVYFEANLTFGYFNRVYLDLYAEDPPTVFKEIVDSLAEYNGHIDAREVKRLWNLATSSGVNLLEMLSDLCT
ncbi:MAG: hypothetical protein NC548_11245 [Lachnospiraceae bacterium]|nr:hypothetical protein [Lachnospiraceae bacterium]MCM1235615.1 hypothetical protein [Ruminococcus flavefaciens]